MKLYIYLSILLLSGLGISYRAYADNDHSSIEHLKTGFGIQEEDQAFPVFSMPSGRGHNHPEFHVLTLEEPELNDLDSDTDTELDQTAFAEVPIYASTHHYFAFRTQKSLPSGWRFAAIPSGGPLYVLFRVFRI